MKEKPELQLKESGDSVNSKQKGKKGELELAKRLNELGFATRRTAQYNGKENGSLADLVGIDGVHIECKRVEKLNIIEAYEQAKRDCKQDEVPTVLHRKNGKPWLVTIWLEDWAELYKEARDGRLHKI